MKKNYDILYVKDKISLDELNKIMAQNYYISCYVVDDRNRYVGIIGKTEYIKSQKCKSVVVNSESKFVILDDNEQECAREIFSLYSSIKKIPVLNKERKIVYEYIRDPLEETVEKLRMQGVTIGESVKIYNSFVDVAWGELITIGNRVTISYSTILAHDASMQAGTGKVKVGKVIIKDDVFIGYQSIILPNVTIGNKVVIGAGTVVAKDIPDNSVCLGNPMRIIETWDNYMEKQQKQIDSSNMYKFIYVKGERQFPSNLKEKMISEMINGIAYIY